MYLHFIYRYVYITYTCVFCIDLYFPNSYLQNTVEEKEGFTLPIHTTKGRNYREISERFNYQTHKTSTGGGKSLKYTALGLCSHLPAIHAAGFLSLLIVGYFPITIVCLFRKRKISE